MVNAPSLPLREKYELEMKKEIKKLQRFRDYFRQALGNPEVKDKTKADEARKRIEQEMENFREMEKEFKMKQYSKKALQHRNRGEEDSEEHSEEISDES